jgi:hypothetical protein
MWGNKNASTQFPERGHGWRLVGQGALAQVITPAGFGTPGGTVHFGPEVFKERRARVMQAL